MLARLPRIVRCCGGKRPEAGASGCVAGEVCRCDGAETLWLTARESDLCPRLFPRASGAETSFGVRRVWQS